MYALPTLLQSFLSVRWVSELGIDDGDRDLDSPSQHKVGGRWPGHLLIHGMLAP